MAKTKEELNALKNEYEALNNKLQELTEDELMLVTGGNWFDVLKKIGEGTRSIAESILKSSNVVSPEETLGGKIPVIPNENKND